jgi:hypothetical protein
MRRRDFFAMIGGAAMACSLPARAQERMRRIGALLPATADDPEFQARMMAFQQELALSGWFIGNNVRIDIRWVTPNPADVRKNAAELVALAPDVILAFGAVTVGAAAAGDPHRADRVPARRRSGRCRPRRQPGPAGRQRHWFPVVRIRHEREMAGVAQADRTGCDTGGRYSGSQHPQPESASLAFCRVVSVFEGILISPWRCRRVSAVHSAPAVRHRW